MSVYNKFVLFFKKIWFFIKTYLFCKLCKKRKNVVIDNVEYMEMSDVSTFDLENHNHIFKSQKPKTKQNTKLTKKKYEPPKITVIDNLDFSYHSDCSNNSDESDEFESAIQF